MEEISLSKKFLALFLVVMLLASVFVGCSSDAPAEEEPAEETTEEAADTEEEAMDEEEAEEEQAMEEEKVLVWNIGASPKTIDPNLNSASDGGHVINNTFEGLMREIDGKLEPAMAESYTVSDDKTVYTFDIRDEAKWSDGEPVTAYDFEYAWDRVVDPEVASEYSWIFGEANVKSWKAIDEDTFEVTLEAPAPYFLGLTGFYTFFPVRKDAVENGGENGLWATEPENAISNGPYKVAEYELGEKIIFKKNENYWRADEVQIETIEGRMIVDEATSLTAYRNGDLHVNSSIPSAEIPTLIAEDPTFYIRPMLGTYYYSLNNDVEVLQDKKVRRALTLSIDRQAITETVTKGGQIPAHSMIPGALLDANGDVFNEISGNHGIALDDSKFEEAKKLLAEAGYPDGEGFPELTILYNTSEGHKNIAEAIQQMWKENLGIDIKLENQEWAVFQDTRTNGDFQIAREGWIGDYSDPLTFLGMFRTGANMNHTGFSSERYDELLEQSKTATGQERFELLYEADKILMEDASVIPIYYYTDLFQIADELQGWELTTRNVFYFGRTSW